MQPAEGHRDGVEVVDQVVVGERRLQGPGQPRRQAPVSPAEQEEAAKEFGETMQDRLLAMVRGKGKRYMVSSEKEMSFMTELMRRKGEVQP